MYPRVLLKKNRLHIQAQSIIKIFFADNKRTIRNIITDGFWIIKARYFVLFRKRFLTDSCDKQYSTTSNFRPHYIYLHRRFLFLPASFFLILFAVADNETIQYLRVFRPINRIVNLKAPPHIPRISTRGKSK